MIHYSPKGVLIPGSNKHRLFSNSRNSRIPFLPPKFRCPFVLFVNKKQLSFFWVCTLFFVTYFFFKKKHIILVSKFIVKSWKIKCSFFWIKNVFASIKLFLQIRKKNCKKSQRVPPVKACHMAMTLICLIFWSLIDKVEELLCANFQPQIAFC